MYRKTKLFLGDLKPLEAIEFTARLHGRPVAQEDVKQILRQLDLPERAWTNRVSRLSGGEDKRVRAAAELVTNPGLLVLDEPTNGLDDVRELRMLTLLRGLSYRGCTVI